jgi:hypothetical protein
VGIADSKVFFPFPKVIRRGLAAQIVPHLLADVMFAQESFPTKQHLTVILEVLGQAFALDIEDAPLILQVADLYKRWFLSDSRPTPMKEDEDFFFLVLSSSVTHELLFLKWRFKLCSHGLSAMCVGDV